MRDPFVMELATGGFVLFGTTDTNLWGVPATGFDCFTSDDLETWQGPVPAFRPPAGFGRTHSSGRPRFIPTWSEGPVTPRDVPCLDGTLFLDDDVAPWIIYSRGSEGTPGGEPGIRDGEMYARRLTGDLRSAAGSPVLLFTASAAPWSNPCGSPKASNRPSS